MLKFLSSKIVILGYVFLFPFFINAQERNIVLNQKAPNIISKDIYGRPVNLQNLTRTKKILLTFQRYAACPVCNYRIRELIKTYNELSIKGVEIVMFIESPQASILKNLKGEKVPFYIIADPGNKFYNMYGVEKSFLKSLISWKTNPTTKRLIKDGEKYVNPEVEADGALKRIEAEFMVNTYGNIAEVHYGEYIGDFIQLEKVKSFVVTQ
jgi:peroxiredoxin Q/BCP